MFWVLLRTNSQELRVAGEPFIKMNRIFSNVPYCCLYIYICIYIYYMYFFSRVYPSASKNHVPKIVTGGIYNDISAGVKRGSNKSKKTKVSHIVWSE